MRVTALFTLLFLVSLAHADNIDKLVGIWKLNPARSKLAQPLGETTMKIQRTASNSYKGEVEVVSSSGEKLPITYNRVCDGHEHHPESQPAGVTEICDPVTLNVTTKRDGQENAQLIFTFARDGKSFTLARKRLGPDGKWIDETLFFERQ